MTKQQPTRPDNRPTVHLVCQAHLDPVWMWPWQEGAREAISTFHTAARLLEEFPDFIFNHNESLLYEWVEENDPALFERIRRLVKAGRWNISGGWYLQPDCNLPGGETLVRVIQEGRRYFETRFGARPTVSYNFDTFGHPASLPQILNQAGFKLYIVCRPFESELKLPAALFRWQGHDGTQVLGLRPDTGGCCTAPAGTDLPTAAAQALNGIAKARELQHDTLVLWGMGDHGGGPTRAELVELDAVIRQTDDICVRHSTPEAYVERIAAQLDLGQAPVHADELQRTFAGCYTSVAPIKRGLRHSEALLSNAERWAAVAWWRTGLPYPENELHKAWKAAMFISFHDVICGSLSEGAMPGVMDLLGVANHAAEQIIFRSQNALLPATPPEPSHIPLYVFNPHPYPMKMPVGTHFFIHYHPPAGRRPFALFDDTGKAVPCQTGGGVFEQSSGIFQPHITFLADIPALSVRRYDIVPGARPARTRRPLAVSQTATELVVENRWLRATFSRQSAGLVSLVDQTSGRELLRGGARLVAMRDNGDAWGDHHVDFNTPIGDFQPLTPEQVGTQWAGENGATGSALRVLPSSPDLVPPGMPGSLACTVEGLTGWQRSLASIQITLYADAPYVDIATRLHWQERCALAKLVLPLQLENPQATCEVPYGAAERAVDGTEHSQTRWLRLDEGAANGTSARLAVGIANNGQYGFAVTPDGTVGLSLARGAVHARAGDAPVEPDEHHTFIDQGQIDTRFRLLIGNASSLAAGLIPLALELNQPLDVFTVFYPPTPQLDPDLAAQPFLHITPQTVQLGALKKADGENALIARLVESAGRATTARLRMEGAPDDYELRLRPYEIATLKIRRGRQGVTIKPCGLMEE